MMDIATFEHLMKALNKRTPFRPYTVELVNGEKIKVTHPEAMAIRGGTASYINPKFVPSWFTHEGVARVIGEVERAATAK